MIKKKETGLFIVISGPSGAGKGTIIQKLLEQNTNIWLSISMISREKRNSEIDGKDYYFISKEEFEHRIENQEFLEYAVVHNQQYYGTPKEKIEEKLNHGVDVLLEIDIQGALKVKELVPEAIFIFIMPPSMNELKERLVKRGTESEEKILARFQTAYQEINALSKYNYVVINDILDEAVDKVNAILVSEKCRVDRIEEVYLGSETEQIHESLLENKQFENHPFRLEK